MGKPDLRDLPPRITPGTLLIRSRSPSHCLDAVLNVNVHFVDLAIVTSQQSSYAYILETIKFLTQVVCSLLQIPESQNPLIP